MRDPHDLQRVVKGSGSNAVHLVFEPASFIIFDVSFQGKSETLLRRLACKFMGILPARILWKCS